MSSTVKPSFDPELAEVLKMIPTDSALTKEVIFESRKRIEAQYAPSNVFVDPEIIHEEVQIPGAGGEIALSVVESKNSVGRSRRALYLIHGGGMVLGTRTFAIQMTFPWIKELDIVVIAVEYRLAPEHPAPAPLDDCYAGLEWVASNASKLGIDADKIMIGGGSAGGGLSAALALLARDRKGPKVFAQLLLYPMIDDRNTSVSVKQYMNDGVWSGKLNIDAWNHYLGPRKSDVTIYDAPSRAEDLSGLPPAYIEVGSAEPFRDENIAYAAKLWECGISAELHVWSGAYHGYGLFAPQATVSKAAVEARNSWIKRMFPPGAN